MSTAFIGSDPTLEDLWRAIVLFGRNSASYKFALAASLLDLGPSGGDLIRLEDLADPFSKHLIRHLSIADKQGSSRTSSFLDTLRKARAGELEADAVIATTARIGFVNVIDAFHRVGHADVPKRFFIDERTRSGGGIRITDEFSRLAEGLQRSNLAHENEARWRLVETAWELGLNPDLLAVFHDPVEGELFVRDESNRRRPVTSCRDALNGYQKGHCFYCFTNIDINGTDPPDVDHFFPHRLKSTELGDHVDGVWNLVLACRGCNRGPGGKFDKVPTVRLLARLHVRNEFLIGSHHPLRETLIRQTGEKSQRAGFLNKAHRVAKRTLIHEWEPLTEMDPPFGPDTDF